MKNKVYDWWSKTSFGSRLLIFGLLIFVLVVIIPSSFAYFFVVEESSSLNIIVGDLKYNVTCEKCNNGMDLEVNHKEEKVVAIKVQNLMNTSSVFTLFYTGDLPNYVNISYLPDFTYDGIGSLGPNETEIVYIKVSNFSGNKVTIPLHFQGGLKEVLPYEGNQIYAYQEDVNPPELLDGMIPVIYKDDKWIKADVSKKWYSYEAWIWANAVTVTEKNREIYMSAEPGIEIPMDDINTMWVWIPRYSYTIKSEDMTNYFGSGLYGYGASSPATKTLPGAIDIKFIDKNVKEDGNAQYVGDVPTTWYTHPAFTFGEQELGGFWYAKFETTGTIESPCTSVMCDTAHLTIRPNEKALSNQIVSSMFFASRSMQILSYQTYGFANSQEYDIHMSKNIEWGAVAYLSQSRFGKYGNVNYEGEEKEVMNSLYVTDSNYGPSYTGCSGIRGQKTNYVDSCPTEMQYQTEIGVWASTSGNIYGVYDMSGGTGEYMMAASAQYQYTAGFNQTNFPELKYCDIFSTMKEETICADGGCLGHAFAETPNWYLDNYQKTYWWVLRGGGTNQWTTTNNGIFNVESNYGTGARDRGFRLVATHF